MLDHFNDSIEGKVIVASGYGNVTWGLCKKAAQLGAKVVTLSGRDGYVYDKDGVVTEEKINYLLEMRASTKGSIRDYAEKFNVPFFPGEKPWGVKGDIAMPCATQNEVGMKEAEKLIESGIKYYIEVSNMSTEAEAQAYLKERVVVAPSKAVNAGGVATSALEMSQNSERLSWTAEEVEARLKDIMDHIYKVSVEEAEKYGLGYDLVAGANLAGFEKVADAMIEQGVF